MPYTIPRSRDDIKAHGHTGIYDGGPIRQAALLNDEGDPISATDLPHTLLDGSAHTDTVSQTVTRGSLVYGNSTPKWDELLIGTAGSPLFTNGTDVSWNNAPTWTGTHTWTRGADATSILLNGFSTNSAALISALDSSAVNIFEANQNGLVTCSSTASTYTGVKFQIRAPLTQASNIYQVVQAKSGGNYTARSIGSTGINSFGDVTAFAPDVVRVQINQGSGQSADMFRARNTAGSIDLVTIDSAGVFSLAGTTSGEISFGLQAAAGTYNFNLPTAAGTAGHPLLSGGGGAAAQTYGVLGIAGGGTAKALTLSAGGIVWTDADSFEVLAGTATAGQILRSGASVTPSWSTATYPATAGTTGNLLVSDGTNWNSTAASALTSAEFLDSAFRVIGSATATKKLAFEVDGFTAATTRTLTPQNASYTIAGLETAQTFTAAQIVEPLTNVVPIIAKQSPGGSSNIFEAQDDLGSALTYIANTGRIVGPSAFIGPLTITTGIKMDIPSAATDFLLVSTDADGNVLWKTPTFKDSLFKIVDDADATKTAVLSLGGATTGADLTLAWTGTADRTVTIPNATTTLAGLAVVETFTAAQTFGVAVDDTPILNINSYGNTVAASNDFLVITDTSSLSNTGFTMTLAHQGIAANVRYTLPLSSATLVGTNETTTLLNKTLSGTGSYVRCGTGHTRFSNATSTTQYFNFVLTALTAARTFTLTDKNHNLDYGTYTPTLTNVTNLAASTAYQCQYSRNGTVVTVSGKVDIDPTIAGACALGITLPIASNLGAAEDCAGAAFASGIAGQGAAIRGDAANDRAEMAWVAADITNQPMYFTFAYEII